MRPQIIFGTSFTFTFMTEGLSAPVNGQGDAVPSPEDEVLGLLVLQLGHVRAVHADHHVAGLQPGILADGLVVHLKMGARVISYFDSVKLLVGKIIINYRDGSFHFILCLFLSMGECSRPFLVCLFPMAFHIGEGRKEKSG